MLFNPQYTETAPTREQVGALPGRTVLEFGTPWCGHCQAAAAVVQSVLAAHPDVDHIRVFDGKGKRLGRVYKVKLWPTLILLQDGTEVARAVRPTRAEDITELLAV